ncbi:MAG TPA: MG2 domain-containing protein, partial [Chitinophagaceae bacterium]|nr:MG2 domain-containing protein [Chitinophagaceae bacterium]
MNFIKYILICSLLIAGFSSFSQSGDPYAARWQKVEDLIKKKNLPQSALEEVREVYSLAKKEGQDAQIVKALVYTISLREETREDNLPASIKELDKEIVNSKEPATSVLKSLQAYLYWQYFARNRWKFYNRTTTVAFVQDDIATWSTTEFHEKISALYLQSIENSKILQATKVASFTAIIAKGNTRHLRPTLYDLLAHEALQYFKNDERDLKKPAYAFVINQPESFSSATEFARHKFISDDSLSLHFKALKVYQELIKFHSSDKDKEALADIDIERIQFVNQHAVLEEKDLLYRKALEDCIRSYAGNPSAAQAAYLLAAHYEQAAGKYEPLKDTTHQYDRVTARRILERVIGDTGNKRSDYIKSEGWTNSYNLLRQIQKEDLAFEVEKINEPNKPFRALIKYRNFHSLHLKIVKADKSLVDLVQNLYDDKSWNALLKEQPLRQWQQQLPPTDDMQQHSVEIKIDSLPVGTYVLLASSTQTFQPPKTAMGATLLHVSNISYVSQQNKYFVLHRQTGQPLRGASVQLWQNSYDSRVAKNKKESAGKYSTDNNGFFELAKDNKGFNYALEVTHGNDQLFVQEDQHYYYYNQHRAPGVQELEEASTTCFLFTDRSIYRPGQTVFFKGIVITGTQDGSKKIREGYKSFIYLHDANHQVADSLAVTSNSYGSFTGRFTLPQNLLNGQFTLYLKKGKGRQAISVEEYKRPLFYVEYEKIKEAYSVNDSILIMAKATAYSGSIISNGKVSYR